MSRFKRQLRSDSPFTIGFGAGINERNDFGIDIRECTEGENFVLDPVGDLLRRRPVQDLVATTPNGGTVTSIMQMVKRDDTQSQLVVDDEYVYEWNGATVFSDVTPPTFTSGATGTRLRSSYWSLDDAMLITDLDLNVPLYKWDGTSMSRLITNIPGSGSGVSVTNLTCAGGTMTATTASAHGLVVGDLVDVASAVQTAYNGQFEVSAVATTNQFQYLVSACTTTPATGTITATKGAVVKAKYSAVHNNRTWLFNIEVDGTAYPHMCLASDFEDMEDYDNSSRSTAQGGSATGNQAFYILSPDLKPINGAVSFFDKLIISTVNGKLFVLSGDDAETYDFDEFYPGSSAQGDEGVVSTGDDLLYFRRGRVVESLRATDKYGDVSTNDVSWWIPDLIKTATAPIAVYDQHRQRCYFFDSASSQVLVYDKEFAHTTKTIESNLSPWTRWTTLMDNGFVTKAAVEYRPSATTATTVYWGDDAGHIYDINGVGLAGDQGSYVINCNRQTRVITELNTVDELMIGRLEYRRNFSATVDLIFAWMDELHQETVTFDLKAPNEFAAAAFWGGIFYWGATGDNAEYWGAGQNVSDSEQVSSMGFSVPGKSTGFVMTVQVADIDEFIIARVYV